MIYYKTKITDISKKDLIKINKICIKFCKKNLGCDKNLKVKLIKNDNPGFYGEFNYDDDTIIIYLNVCKSIGVYTSTFIHEWTHTLQPCKKKYAKLFKKFGYDNHPFEVESRDNEKKYNRILLKKIRTVFEK